MKNNQKGFGAVEGLLLIIIILLVGFIGYYVYHTKNNTNSAYNKAPSSNNSTPTINSNLLKIPDLGIQLALPTELKGLIYQTNEHYVDFYMPDLNSLAKTCEEGQEPMVINEWTKINGQFKDDPGTGLIKQFDGFYIAANGGPNGRICSNEKVIDLKLKYAQALNEASKTVELLK
jgi:hypothetical protein